MSILVSTSTRVITQGITGTSGLFHSQQCRAYAAECQPGVDVFVGGVTPGKGGTTVDGFAVFNSVIEARAKTGARRLCAFFGVRLRAVKGLFRPGQVADFRDKKF